MVTFSLPLIVSTLITTLLTRTDTLMIAYFRSSSEVGLYSTAYPLGAGLSVVLAAFGFVYLSLASRLDADDRREEVNSIYQLTTKWIYITTFPGFLALFAFPADVLSIFFGERYTAAGLTLAVLSVGFFIGAAAGRSRETLSAFGHTIWVLVSNAAAFALNVGLNLVLIPRYGIDGAAVASTLSFFLLYSVVYVVLRIRFDITPFSKWSTRTFFVLPIALLPPTVLLSQQVSLTAVTLPVFLVATGFITIALAGTTGCLQPEDEIPIEVIESRLGVTVPFIRQYIPEERALTRNHDRQNGAVRRLLIPRYPLVLSTIRSIQRSDQRDGNTISSKPHHLVDRNSFVSLRGS